MSESISKTFELYKAWRSESSTPLPAPPAFQLPKGVQRSQASGAPASAGPAFDVMKLLPLSIACCFGLVLLVGYHMIPEEAPPDLARLEVIAMRGAPKVRAEDGKERVLKQGDFVRQGDTILCGGADAAKLQGLDSDSYLIAFEKAEVHLKSFKYNDRRGHEFKLQTELKAGEVVYHFRTKDALWGVDVRLPMNLRMICQRNIQFRVGLESAERAETVVGVGVVAALERLDGGQVGRKVFLYPDQRMESTQEIPVSKPLGAKLLSYRWDL